MSRCPLAALYWFSIKTIGKTPPLLLPSSRSVVTSPDDGHFSSDYRHWLAMLWSVLVCLARVNPGILPSAGIRHWLPQWPRQVKHAPSPGPGEARYGCEMLTLSVIKMNISPQASKHSSRLQRWRRSSLEDRELETLDPGRYNPPRNES